MPRFTVIQGGLSATASRGRVSVSQPGRARLEVIGATLRRRLAMLAQAAPEARASASVRPEPGPIPAQAFLGVRPEGWTPRAALRPVDTAA